MVQSGRRRGRGKGPSWGLHRKCRGRGPSWGLHRKCRGVRQRGLKDVRPGRFRAKVAREGLVRGMGKSKGERRGGVGRRWLVSTTVVEVGARMEERWRRGVVVVAPGRAILPEVRRWTVVVGRGSPLQADSTLSLSLSLIHR
ncbi:hypothetical protein AMTR_s00012p00153330 [Amborella trichopoda]|uniref:Uncharacterized protein n=1 Tax=Amborella trichopoda TaxID=13333 RepID=W1PD12_AMBTC|nr:hypothetical protein AMTR_s00012p00153330 [Amborella trichopoda]